MAEAAKAARGSFSEIKSGASEMGSSTRASMTDAREGVMLLGEQFGVHLPRALTTFLAELGPVAGAIEAAFPFLAVAALAGILIEKLVKMHEAGIELTKSQADFGTAAQEAFNSLDKKILESGIRLDELTGNHADALAKKLKLIDMSSMDDLIQTFGKLDADVDKVFKNLQASWYEFGSGSRGAQNAIAEFKMQYDTLLAQGRSKEASDLLSGTLNSAKESVKKLEQAQALSGGLMAQANSIQTAFLLPGLKAQVAGREKELEAQRGLVQELEAQVTVQGKVAANNTIQKKVVTLSDDQGQGAKRASAANEAAQHQQHMAETRLASDRATADSAMTIQHASIEQRLASDITFAEREQSIKMAANKAEIAGLSKSGKDYTQQLKALQDKAAEITAEGTAKIAELKSKATVAEYSRDIQVIEQGESDKIGAVKEGTAARLAVIDAAIKEEEAKGLQATQHFHELMKQREQEVLKEADVEAKAKAEAASVQAKADAAAAAEKARHTNTTSAIKSGVATTT